MTSPPQRLESAPSEIKPFRLLDLPPELILRVLDFAVVRSTKEKPMSVFKDPQSSNEDLDLYRAEEISHCCVLTLPAITRTCRWLRKEGLKKFFSDNEFCVIDVFYILMDWIAMIGKRDVGSCGPLVKMECPWVFCFTTLPTKPWVNFMKELEYLLTYHAREFYYGRLRDWGVKAYIVTRGGKVVFEAAGSSERYTHYTLLFGTTGDIRIAATECMELEWLYFMDTDGHKMDWWTSASNI